MTDATLVYGLEIIRIINGSLGIENKRKKTYWGEVKKLALFMHS